MASDHLNDRVILCMIRVHQSLRPGFVEKVYRNALMIEFRKQELNFEAEKPISIYYDGQVVGRHRVDLVVEGQLIVELKTVEALNRTHYAQVRSYLKATGLRAALLVNFADVKADFRRVMPSPSPSSPSSPISPFNAASPAPDD